MLLQINSFFFMAEQCSIVYIYIYIYIYHIFFIHSSVNEHLSFFHVLASVNSMAIKVGVLVSFPMCDVCPEVELLNHMVALFLDY